MAPVGLRNASSCLHAYVDASRAILPTSRSPGNRKGCGLHRRARFSFNGRQSFRFHVYSLGGFALVLSTGFSRAFVPFDLIGFFFPIPPGSASIALPTAQLQNRLCPSTETMVAQSEPGMCRFFGCRADFGWYFFFYWSVLIRACMLAGKETSVTRVRFFFNFAGFWGTLIEVSDNFSVPLHFGRPERQHPLKVNVYFPIFLHIWITMADIKKLLQWRLNGYLCFT